MGTNLKPGSVVDWKEINEAFTNYGFVCPATCVLLDVHELLFDRLMTMLNPKSGVAGFFDGEHYGWNTCWSGHDEQAIVQLFWDMKLDWRNIDRGFNYIPWHEAWMQGSQPRVLHYFGKNVWE